MSGADSSPAKAYSRAFEGFVENADDIVGLLAYALYKQDIREARREGREPPPPGQRNPGRTEVAAFRGYAERSIEQVIEQAIQAEEPLWLERGRDQGRLADKAEILQLMRERTTLGAAIFTGVVAWLLSIVITIVVVYAAPGWVRNLADRIDQSAAPPPVSAPK